jgi:hypothetical protein
MPQQMESHMARGLFGVECRAVTPLESEAEEGLRVMESSPHLRVGFSDNERRNSGRLFWGWVIYVTRAWGCKAMGQDISGHVVYNIKNTV